MKNTPKQFLEKENEKALAAVPAQDEATKEAEAAMKERDAAIVAARKERSAIKAKRKKS